MPKAPKGIPREHPNAASSHMGDRCVAATSLRCCGGTPGDQDGRGTNELSKIESILGTRMSQNLSRDRRLACDEDRCQVRKGHGPQVLACLRNAVIGLLRRLIRQPRQSIASMIRHFAAHPAQALAVFLR